MKRQVVVPGETRPTPNCHFTFTRAQTQTHACTQTRTVSSHTLWVRGGVLCESVDTPRCGSSAVLVGVELWLHCFRHIYVVVKISLSPTKGASNPSHWERLANALAIDGPCVACFGRLIGPWELCPVELFVSSVAWHGF